MLQRILLKPKCYFNRNCQAAAPTGLGCTTVSSATTCFCDTDLCNGSETIGIKPMIAIITAILTIFLGKMFQTELKKIHQFFAKALLISLIRTIYNYKKSALIKAEVTGPKKFIYFFSKPVQFLGNPHLVCDKKTTQSKGTVD